MSSTRLRIICRHCNDWAVVQYTIAKDSNGTAYPLFGVNAELVKWLWHGLDSPNRKGEKQSLVRRALLRAADFQGDEGIERLKAKLLVILGGALGHDFQAAEEFMYEHWHAHIELGPYPCPYFLGELQSSATFYPDYRDHVAHQLKVYLLGLYIFDNCSDLKKAIIAEVREDLNKREPNADPERHLEGFCIRWAATALAHDAGYILENNEVQPKRCQDVWPRFREAFQNILAQPLAGQLGLWRREDGLDDDKKKEYLDRKQVVEGFHNEVKSNVGMTWEQFAGKDPCASLYALGKDYEKAAWDALNNAARKAHLHKNKNDEASILEKYYRFAYDRGDGSLQFLDHGVTSALMLLKSWHAYRGVVTAVAERKPPLRSLGDARLADIPTWIGRLRNNDHILAAARAIALHNIDPGRFADHRGADSPLSLTEFKIPLTQGAAQPLAFLLRLADTLQVWDRQKFRPLKTGDSLVEARDFSLHSDDHGTIRVLFRNDFFARGRRNETAWPLADDDSRYSKLRRELEIGLEEGDVKRCVDFDGELDDNGDPDPKATARRALDLAVLQLAGEQPEDANYEEPPEDTEDEGASWSTPDEERERIDSRVGWTLIKDEQVPQFGICAKNALPKADNGCDVARQAMHFVADTCKVHAANYELDQIRPHLHDLLQSLAALAPERLRPNPSATRLRILLETIAYAAHRVLNELPPYGNASGTREPQANRTERLRGFLGSLDLRASDATQIASAVEALAHFKDRLVSIPRLDFSKTVQDLLQRMHPHTEKVEEYRSDLEHNLKAAFSSRTQEIQERFEGTFAPDLTYRELAEGLFDRIKDLPHNRGAYSVWPDGSTGETGGAG